MAPAATAARAETARNRSALVADGLVLGLALASSAYLLAHLIAFQYGRDQGIYAVVADGMLHGKVPYRDLWDFKPPGIFFVFAVARALFGEGMHAVRVCEAAGFASVIYAFVILSRRHVDGAGPGIIAGALAVITHVQLEFWHTAQPSSFGAVALAWALVGATYTPQHDERRGALKQRAAWFGAGALYGIAAVLKPTLGGGILVSVALVALRQFRLRTRAWSALAVPGLVFGGGAALPLLLASFYFLHQGAWGDLYESLFVFAPQYTALSFSTDRFGVLLLRGIEEWAVAFSLLNLVGLVLLGALPVLDQRERAGMAHIGGVVFVLLLGVAVQAKFFPYHYGAALALTALLSGWGFWKLWIRLRRSLLGVALFVMLVGLLLSARSATFHLRDSFWDRCGMRLAALLDPSIRAETNDRLYSVAEVDAGSNRRVAQWLRAHTAATDSVYIWGFEPGIYLMAGRRPASRYVYDVPQRVPWAREKSRQELLEDIARSQPSAIVVAHGDRFPWVTGDQLDSAEALQGFAALQSVIDEAYRPAARIGRFDLYVRRDMAAPHAETNDDGPPKIRKPDDIEQLIS